MIDRLIWHLKRLLPLTYRTVYGTSDGRVHYAVWRMWLGRCFDGHDLLIAAFREAIRRG